MGNKIDSKENVTLLGGAMYVQLPGANEPILLGTTDDAIGMELEKSETLIYTRMTGPSSVFGSNVELKSVKLTGSIGRIDKDVYEMSLGGKFKERIYKAGEKYYDGTTLKKDVKVKELIIGENFNIVAQVWFKGINTNPSATENPIVYMPSASIVITNPITLSSNDAVKAEFAIVSLVSRDEDKVKFLLETR